MKIKGILIFLITIFLIGTISFIYADTGPYTGENQAKKIAQNYLNSHDLPYKVTTTTYMIELYDYHKTKHKKWISSSQLDTMRKNNETFEGEPVDNYYGSGTEIAWKVHVANSQGKEIGSIWVDGHFGEIIKKDLPTPNQNKNTQNNSASNQTDNTTNSTNQTSPESNNQSGPLNNNIGIILATVVIAIVLGVGYWKFSGR